MSSGMDTQEQKVNNLFLIKHRDKYGYISRSGAIVIEPQFEKATDFSEGLANVRVNGKYGYIDESGSIAIKVKFKAAGDFLDGLAYVWMDGKFGYIDTTGAMVIAAKFDGASNFSEGLARVNIGGKDGFINRAGEMVISPGIFNRADRFSEGLAVAQIDGKHGYIDKTGKVVIKPQFDVACHFSEGLARVNYDYSPSVNKYGKWGFINPLGQVVLNFDFDMADDFSEGLAYVNVAREYFASGLGKPGGEDFYIDKTGEIIIDANKCDISKRIHFEGSFSEGMARMAFVEKSNSQSNSRSFLSSLFSSPSKIMPESSGEMKVRYGYIDKVGKIVVNPQFDNAKDFHDGLAGVNIGYIPSDWREEVIGAEGKWGYINKSGEYVWKPTD